MNMKSLLSRDMKIKFRYQLIDVVHVVVSVLLALFIGGLFLIILGYNPIQAYRVMAVKPFSSFDIVLRNSTMYMLSGLAVAVPVKSGVINMGGEGQVAAGAFVAAIIGSSVILPSGLHPAVCLLGAALVGALLSSISAIMKLKFGASEVVTGIMINYIVIYVLSYLAMYPFRASEWAPETARISQTAEIARVGDNSQWSYGLFFALAICFLSSFLLKRTRIGLELKSTGFNPLASKFQGINIKAMALLAMAIGGAMAGFAGAVEVLGGKYLYQDAYFTNVGFDGIAVAYMARNNPIAVIITSIFISTLKVGAGALDRQVGVSAYFSIALQGLIIAFLVSPYLVRSLFEKIKKRKVELKTKHARTENH